MKLLSNIRNKNLGLSDNSEKLLVFFGSKKSFKKELRRKWNEYAFYGDFRFFSRRKIRRLRQMWYQQNCRYTILIC